MSTLLLLLISMMPQNNLEFPHPEFVVKTYPEMVMPGDTLYIVIVATNPYAESIYIMDQYLLFEGYIRFHLRDFENHTQPTLFEAPPVTTAPSRGRAEIKLGDSRFICIAAINVPPLEDLKEPFWEKHLKNLSARDVKFTFCVNIESLIALTDEMWGKRVRKSFLFEIPLVLKSRPEEEMVLIWEWFENSPKELLPGPWHGIPKVPPLKPNDLRFAEFENILVKGEKVSQWNFTRSDNRYPGHPNSPATWQGWKELEDSLTPSTMRDEIRLTRILIQYCDTKDANVLEELKEWFTGMNEVQRTVMAKSICDRARGSYGTNLLVPFRDLYRAIREYDIAAKTNFEIERLKQLELLE